MKCRYCPECDETKLLMSTRAVNNRVETVWICFRCYWLDKFRAGEKAEGRDGKSVLSEEGFEGIDPASSINPLGLRERIQS